MEYLRRRRPDGDDRIITLSSLVSKNFERLASRIDFVSKHSQYGDRFYTMMMESGEKEIDALCDFIQKNPFLRDDLEKPKNQDLITLYCIAYEFLAFKRKAEIPPFVLDYKDSFLIQVQNRNITPTRIEEDWLFLIRFRENLKVHRYPHGKPIHLN